MPPRDFEEIAEKTSRNIIWKILPHGFKNILLVQTNYRRYFLRNFWQNFEEFAEGSLKRNLPLKFQKQIPSYLLKEFPKKCWRNLWRNWQINYLIIYRRNCWTNSQRNFKTKQRVIPENITARIWKAIAWESNFFFLKAPTKFSKSLPFFTF